MSKSYIGLKFGKLKVVSQGKSLKRPENGWLVRTYICICTCGKLKTVRATIINVAIKNKNNSSCGSPGCKTVTLGVKKQLVGQKFGKLTVVSEEKSIKRASQKGYRRIFKCRCECGTIVIRPYNSIVATIRDGHKTTCGQISCKIGYCFDDLSGKEFGKLKVINFSRQDKNGHSLWSCECICGNIVLKLGTELVSGHLKSCSKSCGKVNDKGVSSWNTNYANYKNGAERRLLSFGLSIKQFISICSMNCIYCGQAPQNWNTHCKKNGSIKLTKHQLPIGRQAVESAWIKKNGVDRLDNSKGYTIKNSVPCCKNCNMSKSSLSLADWIKFLSKFDFKIGEKVYKRLKLLGIKA